MQKKWQIRLTWKSKTYTEIVTTAGQQAAIDAIKARYPGCRIQNVKRVL